MVVMNNYRLAHKRRKIQKPSDVLIIRGTSFSRCSCNIHSLKFPLLPSPAASQPLERPCPLSVSLMDIPTVGDI